MDYQIIEIIEGGVKNGNNAAWLCDCRQVLLGAGFPPATREKPVRCPRCCNTYKVLFEGGYPSKVLKICQD